MNCPFCNNILTQSCNIIDYCRFFCPNCPKFVSIIYSNSYKITCIYTILNNEKYCAMLKNNSTDILIRKNHIYQLLISFPFIVNLSPKNINHKLKNIITFL